MLFPISELIHINPLKYCIKWYVCTTIAILTCILWIKTLNFPILLIIFWLFCEYFSTRLPINRLMIFWWNYRGRYRLYKKRIVWLRWYLISITKWNAYMYKYLKFWIMQLNFSISCTKSNTFNYQLTLIVKKISIVQTLFIYVFKVNFNNKNPVAVNICLN